MSASNLIIKEVCSMSLKLKISIFEEKISNKNGNRPIFAYKKFYKKF